MIYWIKNGMLISAIIFMIIALIFTTLLDFSRLKKYKERNVTIAIICIGTGIACFLIAAMSDLKCNKIMKDEIKSKYDNATEFVYKEKTKIFKSNDIYYSWNYDYSTDTITVQKINSDDIEKITPILKK